MLQTPYAQEGVPCVLSHTAPQVPQLVTLALVLDSQPSAAEPLQF
jgi:hypothetical protein